MESPRYQPRSRFYSAGSAASFASQQLAPIQRPHAMSEPNVLQYQPLVHQMPGAVKVNPSIGQATVFPSDLRGRVKTRGGAGLDNFHRHGSNTVVVNPPQMTKQFLSDSAETDRQLQSSKRTRSVRPKLGPAKRCVRLGRSDTCVDASRKKRGRPCNGDRRMSNMNNVTMYAITAPSTSVPPTLQHNLLSRNPTFHYSQSSNSQKQLLAPFSSGAFHFPASETYIPVSLSYSHPQSSDTIKHIYSIKRFILNANYRDILP
ncbi:hypothetical protein BZG36_02444 [Bifiguratus adelaidae]|uniref:Uncharacterized protein n=1 Tax=Bifiguratus adelaidae TaxID=1938954 RepID=A0A261Y3Z6_9FUNG|nr:hypothetical protein BZG36_02444 [Bifiguratus adelaidae]